MACCPTSFHAMSEQAGFPPFIYDTYIDGVKERQEDNMDGFSTSSSYMISFGQMQQLAQRPRARKWESPKLGPRSVRLLGLSSATWFAIMSF